MWVGLAGDTFGVVDLVVLGLVGEVVPFFLSLVFHSATVLAMSFALAKTGRGVLRGLRGVNAPGRRDATTGLRVASRFLVDGESKTDLRALRGMPLPVALDFAGVEGLERGVLAGALARDAVAEEVSLWGVIDSAVVVFRPMSFCCS
jgi:hypothetical protein